MKRVQVRDLVHRLFRYFRELEEYKWQYGSSCCMPSHTHTESEHNPFHFDQSRASVQRPLQDDSLPRDTGSTG